MCMEDYRIARRIYIRQHRVDFNDGPLFTLNADANRVGVGIASWANIAIAVSTRDDSSSTEGNLIWYGFPSADYRLPLTIRDYGQAIMGTLYFIDHLDARNVVSVTEYILQEQ